MRVRFLLAVAAVACCFLASCSGPTSGDPLPTSGSGGEGSGGESSSSSAQAAPKVQNPLHPTEYKAHPCRLLTDDQMAAFDFTSSKAPKERSHGGSGKGCGWYDNTGMPSAIHISWIVDNEHGLSDTYAQYSDYKDDGYFKPDSVKNYPAVFADKSDDRSDGHCILVTGVNDGLEFFSDVNMGIDRESEACDVAKKAAAAAIETMKGGG